MRPSFVFLTVLGVIISVFSYGQGTVNGKIIDKNGESLIGVVIRLKSDPTTGKTTDLDGNFSIKLNDSTTQTLVITYFGFDTINETVQAVNNQVIVKNFTLQDYSLKLKEVQIVAKATKAKEYYMENVKKNSSNSIDYISAETMKKTGDATVEGAMARVSGVSLNGDFISVRGIGDRYIRTTVNGLRIPTLDPFRNNLELDMFPAAMIDNIVIVKTASPDLPGDWSGAYVDVQTKDYTEKLTINFETSFGYNNQTTFKDVISSQSGPTDWLGYASGVRTPNINSYQGTNVAPTAYSEFVALGLGSYFKSLGVTSDFSKSPANQTYYKLGLIQLGLLGADQMNNQAAYQAALSKFNTEGYHAKAYEITNAGAVKFGQSMPNDWRTTTKKANPNFTQTFSISNEVKLFGKPLSFFAAVRYASTTQYDPNSKYTRVGSNTINPQNGLPTDTSTTPQQYSIQEVEWSALFNLSYKYSKNNSISLLFMPNLDSENKAASGITNTSPQFYNERQLYESRKQIVYQLKSIHYIPVLKMNIVGNASYTRGNSIVPDYRKVGVPVDTFQQNSLIPSADRIFRYLQENVFDSKLAAEIPLSGNTDEVVRKIKFGGAFQRIDRSFDQYDFALASGTGATVNAGNQNVDPFALQNFNFQPTYMGGIISSTQLRYYDMLNLPTNHTMGYSNIGAVYGMLDYAIVPRFRVSGGLRIENAYLYTDVKKYDSLHLAVNDPRRYSDQVGLQNPGILSATSFLPSITTIYNLKKDHSLPLNLRASFSQSVARPSLRELSSISVYDFELNGQVVGNDSLKMVHINNYDLRLESYFKSGDNVSVSLFYKTFTNYIELETYSVDYTWVNNSNKTWLQGIEFEGKKGLTKYFELRANVTFVSSHDVFQKILLQGPGVTSKGETVSRPLYGQSPYVINGMLTYKLDKIGLTATLSYNVQGKTLSLDAGGSGIPDVYQLPRNVLDMKVSKKLGKHFGISLRVNNILNAPIRRVYNYAETSTPIYYDLYRFGTLYTFSFIYNL